MATFLITYNRTLNNRPQPAYTVTNLGSLSILTF